MIIISTASLRQLSPKALQGGESAFRLPLVYLPTSKCPQRRLKRCPRRSTAYAGRKRAYQVEWTLKQFLCASRPGQHYLVEETGVKDLPPTDPERTLRCAPAPYSIGVASSYSFSEDDSPGIRLNFSQKISAILRLSGSFTDTGRALRGRGRARRAQRSSASSRSRRR
jgi:hypothetical protein